MDGELECIAAERLSLHLDSLLTLLVPYAGATSESYADRKAAKARLRL
jgi:hypothetical protein